MTPTYHADSKFAVSFVILCGLCGRRFLTQVRWKLLFPPDSAMKKLFHFDAPREKYHCRDANAEAVRHERELHRAAANLKSCNSRRRSARLLRGLRGELKRRGWYWK